MASPLAEAITAGVVASMDPSTAMTRDAMKSYVETQRTAALTAKSDAVTEVAQALTKAVETNAPASVIGAYEKILGQLTA